ncbi:hypothetical protein EXIGLDRAFT_769177 [Exidia glandulosa HHB12029]|uniref:Uncharacterized protein n=1 Tax=Exidia glandulosa HHB12029 TaxID=1314781 RepID=A0A165HMQ0_EXIGL|nr:hypothetical protein EXIGLDRAFT_769177 [Exidia glandulosa HHB12029]
MHFGSPTNHLSKTPKSHRTPHNGYYWHARTAATGKNQAQPRAKNAKLKEAAVQDAFNMQELLDELAAYKAELAAVEAKEAAQRRKALNEIQAAVQEDKQNDTVRVERLKGSAGDSLDGFGEQGDAVPAFPAHGAPLRRQGRLARISRFIDDWATAEFIKTLLKNRRAAAARRARIERAADDADMDVDEDF